jgi:hypothetical protein
MSNTLTLNKLGDSATGRALDAAVQGSAVLTTFVDFTSDLVRNVFETLITSSMEQLTAYADLVSQVSGSLANYEDRTLGDINVASLKYMNEVVLPRFGDMTSSQYVLSANQTYDIFTSGNNTIATISLDATKLTDFNALFAGVTATLTPVAPPANPPTTPADVAIDGFDPADITNTLKIIDQSVTPPVIKTQYLFAFSKAILKRDVKKSYDLLVTILKLGMQKIVVTDGEIHTKLTFHVDAADTDETTSSQSQVDTSVQSTSFVKNRAFGGGSSASGKLGKFLLSASFSGGASSTKAGASSQSTVRVNVANEKHTAQTSIAIDILGEVTVKFRSDFFPSFDPTG